MCFHVCVGRVKALHPTAVHSVFLAVVKKIKCISAFMSTFLQKQIAVSFAHQTKSFLLNLPIWLPNSLALFIIHHRQAKKCPVFEAAATFAEALLLRTAGLI